MIKKKSICLLSFFVLLATACTPSSLQTEDIAHSGSTAVSTQGEIVAVEVEPTETPIPSTAIPEPTQKATLELSKDLVRGCLRGDMVHFFIVYTKEAHPVSGRQMEYIYDEEGNPIEQPMFYGERVEMALRFIADDSIFGSLLGHMRSSID